MPEKSGDLLTLSFQLCIFLGFLLHFLAALEIPLGSKLSIEDGNHWISPNGDFAFGFFNCSDQSSYSIGIRFNSQSIPLEKQILVWVAGDDLTLGNSSYIQLTQDGELLIFDSLKGVTIWTTKKQSVVSAALNDNGNLVLLNPEKQIVWQSFDSPSDTLLPGQNFSLLQTLRAARKNSMSSYYTLFMNASGQLQLRWESHVIYWTSESPSSSNLSVFLTPDGALQLRDQNAKSVWSVFGEDHNDSISYRFLKLDVDGNLRLYSWANASKSWRSVWQAVENQCNVFATCGQDGICVIPENGSPECQCPFNQTNEPTGRCMIPNLRCPSTDIVTYNNTVLYGIYPPMDDLVAKTSLRGCKSLCLNDPSCMAVTFSNDGTARCLMKRTQYVTGYSDPSLRSVSFVKICIAPLAVFPVDPKVMMSPPPSVKRSRKVPFPYLIGAAMGTVVAFVLVQLALGFWFYRRRKLVRDRATFAYTDPNSNGLIVLSFSEIKELTENFMHQIGPKMFKGVLPNKKPVAIKDFIATIEERKYRGTVSKIGSIHHKNLVKLQGYCCQLNHRFLVYEYLKNGSVEKYIEDPKLCKKLTWGKRFDICLAVARAICYLHTSCREFMSHGNMKWENVLLDENLEAKVSEFGLGKVVSEISFSSAERDVEDFGKMVLVLVSGCREVGDLCEWTYKEWSQGNPENVVDRRISGGFIPQELERVLRIAFWCLQIDERRRPSMREVVKVLEGTLSVDPPPPPFAGNGPLDEEKEPPNAGSEP